MTDEKFVCSVGKFLLLHLWVFASDNNGRESQWIGPYGEAEPKEGYKDQLGAGVREANTEVQFVSYFDCFERLDRVANHREVSSCTQHITSRDCFASVFGIKAG
jgi:hypothetical protein